MTDFPHFAGLPVFDVTVEGTGADATIPVSINGHTIKVKRNTPTRMPEPFKRALLTGGYRITATLIEDQEAAADEIATGDLGEGDLGAGAGGTGEDGSSPSGTFDAEAVINGNVAEVTERLATLSAEQLAAVKAAEEDREQSRKGVLEAIAKLTAEPPAE